MELSGLEFCSPTVARGEPRSRRTLPFPAGTRTPLSACRAEVCLIACICKMWACRARRRNFPLKGLILKRNEARAGEHKQQARLACSPHAQLGEKATRKEPGRIRALLQTGLFEH